MAFPVSPPCIFALMSSLLLRVASFNGCPPMPSRCWPTRLARDGYFYDIIGGITCFYCRAHHPTHSRDCNHKEMSISGWPDFLRPIGLRNVKLRNNVQLIMQPEALDTDIRIHRRPGSGGDFLAGWLGEPNHGNQR